MLPESLDRRIVFCHGLTILSISKIISWATTTACRRRVTAAVTTGTTTYYYLFDFIITLLVYNIAVTITAVVNNYYCFFFFVHVFRTTFRRRSGSKTIFRRALRHKFPRTSKSLVGRVRQACVYRASGFAHKNSASCGSSFNTILGSRVAHFFFVYIFKI